MVVLSGRRYGVMAMLDMLSLPSAPWLLLSMAGALVAMLGLTLQERRRWAFAGFWRIPSAWGMRGRFLVYQIIGVSGAMIALGAVWSFGLQGRLWYLCLALAFAWYLWTGWVIPRRPLMQLEQHRKLLRRLTPSFVGYIRTAIAGQEDALTLFSRYIERTDSRIFPMQLVIRDVLTVVHAQQVRPFEALRRVTLHRGCDELFSVAELLAQAERHGTDIDQMLALSEQTFAAVLAGEITRQSKRRSLYVVLAGAFALVIGLLGNLLFVVTAGGSLLQLGA